MDLAHALQVATEAAVAAGELIRKDFHRPGGARGYGDKAEVDVEAEWLIQKRLLEAFPEWGVVAEERGGQAALVPGTPVWLVDPNDGTAAYLKGRRGSCVSIGLVHDGRPILGVIYNATAPDDRGDLFTWAEGCGPLRRNGVEVTRPDFPNELEPHDIVMLSQSGDNKATANLERIRPARYRAIPSIAWRLALVAVGEGVAAISLNGPTSYDLGAGHALLRGVGGEVVDCHGRPLTYTPDGHIVNHSHSFFGGAPHIARTLAATDWDAIFEEKSEGGGRYDLLKPGRGLAVEDVGVLSRAQGCLLGQVAGDSLGSLVEFKPASLIRERHPEGLVDLADGGTWNTLAGQPTDDSELALMLARAIVLGDGYAPEHAAQAYGFWYRTMPFDIGTTTSRALGPIQDAVGAEAARIARSHANPQSQANGSLMRVSPLAVWGWSLDPDVLATHARQDSLLTHPHPVCQDACAVFTVAIAHAIRTGDGPGEVFERALSWARQHVGPEVVGAIEQAREAPPADFMTKMGWVLVALRNAFHELLHAASVQEGVSRTVMRGGDTDTNGAIAGALLGAVHGRPGIPEQWRQMVVTCRPARGFCRTPRPRAFWPVDVLDLAERLLALGSAAAAPGTGPVSAREPGGVARALPE